MTWIEWLSAIGTVAIILYVLYGWIRITWQVLRNAHARTKTDREVQR